MVQAAMRLLTVAFLANALVGMTAFGAAPESKSTNCIPIDSCCKVCDSGKACGNSCISRRYNCHKGRGCACDAERVCEEDKGE